MIDQHRPTPTLTVSLPAHLHVTWNRWGNGRPSIAASNPFDWVKWNQSPTGGTCELRKLDWSLSERRIRIWWNFRTFGTRNEINSTSKSHRGDLRYSSRHFDELDLNWNELSKLFFLTRKLGLSSSTFIRFYLGCVSFFVTFVCLAGCTKHCGTYQSTQPSSPLVNDHILQIWKFESLQTSRKPWRTLFVIPFRIGEAPSV